MQPMGGVATGAADQERHVPVLIDAVCSLLALPANANAVDCTFGGGGYTRALLAATAPSGRVLAIDRDPDAVARGQVMHWTSEERKRLTIIHGRFRDVQRIARAHHFERIRAIVADLGLSSLQLDASDRGFSFRTPAPLDMRFDPTSSEPTAAELLATASVSALTRIVREFGEERFAERIATEIVRARRRSPIRTTTDLVDCITRVVPRSGRIHPATRVFQALRIAVNDELHELDTAISAMLATVDIGGRVAIVSFHSLEDRIVKRAFRAAAHRGAVRVLTTRPVCPSSREREENPRSRSAKLRCVERIA